ncbi:Hypothetical Protein FCC1311_000292 [Hondaea fermentalgiana]|uniref:Ppx/GppA phosphatase N-terminal domain-containing protein n=1 Tax=Hondaea fermentalgiana TaxID=2315210 RepID=A0A2R5G0J3_9STRA|nr:Hypothetical Protein FCC1311_000292 [Hondaea fermentalgiana]|eukprot:GBG23809.1 Hypothetical Protein FCC1311_000292 [Hondaea fermentalgiana]
MQGAVRAAVDVGSGSTKLVVARLAQKAGGLAIDEVLLHRETEVLLAHALESSTSKAEGGETATAAGEGEIGAVALQECRDALQEYKKAALDLGAPNLEGVGTAVFRLAKDGPAFLDALREQDDINVRLISQAEEGKLGWATACAVTGMSPSEEAAKDLVCWDSGGGSFQLSWNQGSQLFKGPMGTSTVTAALVRLQGREFSSAVSPNPVQASHVDGLRDFIRKTLEPLDKGDCPIGSETSRVVAIGGDTCAFNIARLAIGSDAAPHVVQREALDAAIGRHLNLDDEALIGLGYTRALQPSMVVSKLVLVSTVMEIFNVKAFEYCPSTGSCLGVLLSQAAAA